MDKKLRTRTVHDIPSVHIRFGDITATCVRYSLGRNNAMKLAEEANAVVRIGRLVRVDFNAVDKYLKNNKDVLQKQ